MYFNFIQHNQNSVKYISTYFEHLRKGISPDSYIVAPVDHVAELLLAAAAALELVADGLVALPPRPERTVHYTVLIDRRHLRENTKRGD